LTLWRYLMLRLGSNLTLQWRTLTLLHSLMLLLQLNGLSLLLMFLNGFVLLLLLLYCMALLLLENLLFLLLRDCLVVNLQNGRRSDIAIRGDWPVDCQVGRTTVVDAGKLCTVAAGGTLVLNLRAHRRSVLFVLGSQLGGPGAHLQTA